MNVKRCYPIGAEIVKDGVHFRVWAPNHSSVKIVFFEQRGLIVDEKLLEKEDTGYFSLFVPKLKAGALYLYYLNDSSKGLPDPASRFQPHGVEGPSAVVDVDFHWSKEEENWPGISSIGQIIYEMHIGTFTKEGTFYEAKQQLRELSQLGITLIELMPVNAFPGNFGWGYDGINLFAPYEKYGTPNDLKAFIDECHKYKIGVMLDVVYNHFGPEGNYISQFSKEYFNPKQTTDWGSAINFDHPSTREFFVTNAKYWIEEFHFDGLRIDATPAFFCTTKEHILTSLTQAVKNSHPFRKKIIIGENESQDNTLLKSVEDGGYGFDAVWNDDFHHAALVRLKGKREAYYSDYLGSPQEFISSLKYGFLYQGQYYYWQKKNRGSSTLEYSPSCFVIFLENHDQIGNSISGRRLHQLSDPGNYRAMTALFLLSCNTPLIFQGQEFASSAPFYYFADHKECVNQKIYSGRKNFLAQFSSLKNERAEKEVWNPSDVETFTKCKLDFTEREKNAKQYKFFKDLITLRKNDPVFQNVQNIKIDGAVLGADSFLLRFFGADKNDRLLLVNFGADQQLLTGSEPLLVAGDNAKWEILLSTSSIDYGGEGIAPFENPMWKISGHSALVLGTKKETTQ